MRSIPLGVSAVVSFALLSNGCVSEGPAYEEATEGTETIETLPDDELFLLSSSQLLTYGLTSYKWPETPLPASQQTVLLTKWDSPIRNQANTLWCTSFSTIAAMENLVGRHLNQQINLSETDHFTTYNQTYQLAAAQSAATTPIAPETAWPFKGSAASDYKAQRATLIQDYVAPQTRDEFFAELNAGYPMTIGIKVYPGFNQVGPDGIIPLPSGTASKVGHAMAVTGFVRDPNVAGGGYLVLKNSWGTGWGANGYGKLPVDFCKLDYCFFISVRSVKHQNMITPKNGEPPVTRPTLPTTPQPAIVNEDTVRTVMTPSRNVGGFLLKLETTPEILAKIASVRYHVHRTFGTYEYSGSTDRASGFTSTTSYTTRVSGWRTTGTELTLTDGTKVQIPGALIRF